MALGELIVRVGANIAEFTSAMTKVDARLASLNRSIANMGSSVAKNLTGQFVQLAAATLAVGTAMNAISAAFKVGDDLQALSDTTGAAVEDLNELAIVGALNGVSMEGLGKAYKGMNKAMVESLDATSKSAKIFKALGVETKNADGSFKTTTETLKALIPELAKIEDETLRTAVGTELLSKAYAGIAPMVRNYEADMKVAAQTTAIFGKVSKETAALTDALGDDLTILSEGGKRALLNNLTPAFEALHAVIQSFLNARDKVGKDTSTYDWAALIVKVMGGLGDVLRLTADAFLWLARSIGVVYDKMEQLASLGATVFTKLDKQVADLAKNIPGTGGVEAETKQRFRPPAPGVAATGIDLTKTSREYQAQLEMNRKVQKAQDDLAANSDSNDRRMANSKSGFTAKVQALMDALTPATKKANDALADFADKVRSANLAESLKLDERTVEGYVKLGEALAAGKLGINDYNTAVARLLDSDSHLKKEQDELNKILDATYDSERDLLKSTADLLQKQMDEAGAIGLTEDALIAYNYELKRAVIQNMEINPALKESALGYLAQAEALEKSNASRKKAYDAGVKGVEAGRDLLQRYQEEAGAIGKTGLALEQYNIELARTKALTDVTDPAMRARIGALFDLSNAQAAANATMKAQAELAAEVNQIFSTEFANAITSVVDGTKTISQAFKDMAKNIANALAQIAAKQLAEKLFGGGSGGFDIGGIIAKLFMGGGFGGTPGFMGGTLGYGTAGSLIPAGQFPYALGGDPPMNKVSIVGERGPELIYPRMPISVAPITPFSLTPLNPISLKSLTLSPRTRTATLAPAPARTTSFAPRVYERFETTRSSTSDVMKLIETTRLVPLPPEPPRAQIPIAIARGASGLAGAAGTPGLAGAAGAAGAAGLPGVPGLAGMAGAPGTTSVRALPVTIAGIAAGVGKAGAPGAAGAAGAAGLAGLAGLAGAAGAAGAAGLVRFVRWVSAAVASVRPVTPSQPPPMIAKLMARIDGLAGESGAGGKAGLAGLAGAAGRAGAGGAGGVAGPAGLAGLAGAAGAGVGGAAPAGAFGFQHGGNPPMNKFSIVGEHGPELIYPRFPFTVEPMDKVKRSSGGATTVVQNFTVPARADTQTIRQQAKAGYRAASGAARRG